MPFKVGVTAPREGLRAAQISKAIHEFNEISLHHDFEGPIEFHQGCCVGGDEQLSIIASTLGWHIVAHPPEQTKYFSRLAYDLSILKHVRKPYLYRNEDIVNTCNILYGFPKGVMEELRSGTWSTIRYARKRNREHRIVAPNGDLI